MKRVWVLGAGGMLGAAVTRALRRGGAEANDKRCGRDGPKQAMFHLDSPKYKAVTGQPTFDGPIC